MSSTEISYTESKTLNLLLKQQVITQIEKSEGPNQDEIINFQQTIKLHEQETLNQFPPESTYNEGFFDKCDDIKIQLGNIQLEESSSIEKLKTLCESYDLLENLLDHILQHVECVILEIKTSNKLVLMLNHITSHDQQQETSPLDSSPKELLEAQELQKIKNKLHATFNKYEKVTLCRQEYLKRKNDYLLALKNFKIILEVIDISEECLEKLQQQFYDVVVGYRNCRRLLEEEMPLIMAERTKILGECLVRLGENNKKLMNNKMDLIHLMDGIGKALNSSQHVAIKDKIFK